MSQAAATTAAALPRRAAPRRRIPPRRPLLVLAMLIWISPFVVLVLTAFRSETDFLSHGPWSIPSSLTLSSFSKAWDTGQFGITYRNSILVTLIKVPLGVAIAAPLAYSIARLRLRWGGAILFIILLGLSIPIFIIIVPMFTMLRSANLVDSIWGLLPPYLAVGLPFEVLILQTFFRQFLITVLILDTVATWNELLMALIVLSSAEHRTVPLGLLNFQGQFATNYTGLSAGILIAIVPILVIYALLQRWILSGLTAGALKG
jgi:raffinose/stachyose/melibiose transport system permease protein